MSDIHSEIRGQAGLITLNRPQALNALSLSMIRELNRILRSWQDLQQVKLVAIRGSSRNKTSGNVSPFGAFSAGGDIRFFHQAVLNADAQLEDFFTEEYSLNHLIHHYPKPYLAFMDGIVMGGGMGISQGAQLRIVTERTKMAMPETHIGLFPDVGGGYFLSRCPGFSGEWLALSGAQISPQHAIALNLADVMLNSAQLGVAWDELTTLDLTQASSLTAWVQRYGNSDCAALPLEQVEIDSIFSLDTVSAIIAALEASSSEWAKQTASQLRRASPLMLAVTLAQIRRARTLDLGEDLRMERDLVRHCFNTRHLDRFGVKSETMEGIRALAVDKDHQPKWQPARIEEVKAEMVLPFFDSPWPTADHPLRDLS